MNKILLDSLYINNSGGLRLLKYLVKQLQSRNIPFHLLADNRCQGIFDDMEVEYLAASLFNRCKYYQTLNDSFSKVFCFGNIPPPIKLSVPVYTYFHNINLLTLAETSTFKNKILSWLKRQIFRNYKNNTDFWFVQTQNTANELISHLGELPERTKLMPFYELSEELHSLSHEPHGDDYVFISNYTGAKGHEELLEAWKLLHQEGFNMKLHLTVPDNNSFVKKIVVAQQHGINVENHGFVAFEQVVNLYRRSKVLIYPSHNESLGLGIIEAVAAGCDVLGADLPYTYSVCKPSGTFNPYQVESIVNCVAEYEKGKSLRSELVIDNKINSLIDMLGDGVN